MVRQAVARAPHLEAFLFESLHDRRMKGEAVSTFHLFPPDVTGEEVHRTLQLDALKASALQSCEWRGLATTQALIVVSKKIGCAEALGKKAPRASFRCRAITSN